MKSRLVLSPAYLDLFTTGQNPQAAISASFPARHIETDLDWDDLVLYPEAQQQIDEIKRWIEYSDTLTNDWGLANKLNPGYRCLFHGPSGTGKTLAASLLGKSTGRETYLTDLSLAVSKYIGETEKTLSRVFDQAQSQNWILFLDEADALFGRRSTVQDSHDRYANQEVSYLLQRIESYDGVCILATNAKQDIDQAFLRRFQSTVFFQLPDPGERLKIWQRSIPKKAGLADNVDLALIASNHSLSGGAIMQIVRYSALQAIAQGDNVIRLDYLEEGIRKEHAKKAREG